MDEKNQKVKREYEFKKVGDGSIKYESLDSNWCNEGLIRVSDIKKLLEKSRNAEYVYVEGSDESMTTFTAIRRLTSEEELDIKIQEKQDELFKLMLKKTQKNF